MAFNINNQSGPRLLDGSDMNALGAALNGQTRGVILNNPTIFPSQAAYLPGANTTVGNATLTALQLTGGYLVRSGPTAAFTDTTDTAANIFAITGAVFPAGTSEGLFIQNTTQFAQTLQGGTGVTFVGGINIIPAYSSAYIQIAFTSATALTMTVIALNTNIELIGSAINTVSGNTPLTLTGANIAGSSDITILLTAVLAGAGTITLPTIAQTIAAIANGAPGLNWNLRIINASSGAFAWTVGTSTGWTLNGTMSIAQNTFRDFIINLPTATTGTLTSAGTGTYS